MKGRYDNDLWWWRSFSGFNNHRRRQETETYMHKNWKGNVKWLDLPMEAMHKLFRDEKRHDVLGSWGPDLSRIDDETGISRDVTDEEVLAYAKSIKNPEDPEVHLFNKFKTNQLIAKLMRGAIQLGYRKEHFDPECHMPENQTEDAPQMHSSCYQLLSKLACTVARYRQYSLLQT